MSKIVIGIDISKKTFDAAMLLPNKKIKNKKFDNKQSGFLEFINWYDKSDTKNFHVCMEATGIYGDALATYLFDIGITVSVVNPAQIKGFGQSLLVRTKNDKVDSVLIARFCEAINPKSWKPAPLHVRELQALIRRLDALQDMHMQENNRFDVSTIEVQASITTIMLKLGRAAKNPRKWLKSNLNNIYGPLPIVKSFVRINLVMRTYIRLLQTFTSFSLNEIRAILPHQKYDLLDPGGSQGLE